MNTKRRPNGWPQGTFMHRFIDLIDAQRVPMHDIATKAGLSRYYLSGIRSGRRNPTILCIEALLQTCDDELELTWRKRR